MRFRIYFSRYPHRRGDIITDATGVIWASPCLAWSVGLPFFTVHGWCQKKGFGCYTVSKESKPPKGYNKKLLRVAEALLSAEVVRK